MGVYEVKKCFRTFCGSGLPFCLKSGLSVGSELNYQHRDTREKKDVHPSSHVKDKAKHEPGSDQA